MDKEKEKQIILRMAKIREAKLKDQDEVLDLEGKLIQKNYDIALKEDKLEKLYLDLGELRMQEK